MNTVKLSLPSRGIDVVTSEGALAEGSVRRADNIVLQATGEFTRRPGDDGTSRIALAGAHSLWRGCGMAFAAAENQLYQLSSDMTSAQSIFTGLPIGHPVEYTEINGTTYFTAPSVLGKITSAGQVRRPGVADLVGYRPTLTATMGGLTPGTYGLAYSLSNDLGEESGLSNMAVIDLPTGGGILLSGLVQASSAPTINIYVTAANGGDLRLNQSLAFAGTVAVRDQKRSRPATKLARQCMPGGITVRHHNGRLYTALGKHLTYSDEFDYGITDVKKGWITFGGRITMVQPVIGGLFVGLHKRVVFLAGSGPGDFELRQVSNHGAVPNSSTHAPAEYFNGRMVPNQSGEVAVWLSNVGLVVGLQDGSVVHAQAGRVSANVGGVGRPAVLQQMGIKQALFCVESMTMGKAGAVDQTIPGRYVEEISSSASASDTITS